MTQQSAARHWHVTILNPTEEDITRQPPPHRYMIVAHDHQDTIPRMRIYIVLNDKKRATAMRKWRQGAIYEMLNTTSQQLIDSLKQAESYTESGEITYNIGGFFAGDNTMLRTSERKERPTTAKRKADYQEAYELAKQGRFTEIKEEIALKHMGNLVLIHQWHQTPSAQ